jgi:hypothetical protein
MRKNMLLTLTLLVVCFASSLAAPVSPIPTRRETLEAFASKSYTVTFQACKRANVVLVGDGMSYLGLYVYDRHGNCICKDDQAAPPNKDDCAVEWFPPREQVYTIEVRNLGPLPNKCVIAIQ